MSVEGGGVVDTDGKFQTSMEKTNPLMTRTHMHIH